MANHLHLDCQSKKFEYLILLNASENNKIEIAF